MPGEASLEDQRLLSLVSTLLIKQGLLREAGHYTLPQIRALVQRQGPL